MKKLRKAIEEYNRYRGAEARAEIIEEGGDEVRIRFTGPFCTTCGYYDWIEDLIYLLEDHGVEAEIKEIRDLEFGAEALFKIKKEGDSRRQPSV